MSPMPKWLTAVLHGVLISITVSVVLVTFFVTMPQLETRYWPVVEKLDIISIQPAADGRTVVYGQFDKIRQCEYIGISWFHRDTAGTLNRVVVELMRRPGDTSSPNRPLGLQKAGPWIIAIPYNELKGASYVELTHRCHPFWTTVTQFYP